MITILYITDIYIDTDNLIIECDDHYVSTPIINGSIQINIIDLDNNNIGINGIKINDSIKIFYYEKINDMIKPIKIIKINNYVLNDSSSSEELL